MNRKLILSLVFAVAGVVAAAQEFNPVPRAWKWLDSQEAIFSYDGSFADEGAFAVNAKTGKRRDGVQAPAKYSAFPIEPAGAVNLT